MDYAQAVARVLSTRILEARTTTARGTVTAVTADGFVTFSDAVGTSRKGVWLTQQPAIGSVITYLDEGYGIPLVLGSSGTTAWTAVTFQNSWANFGAGYASCAYRKVGDMVQLRGLATGGLRDTTIFTLPTGYRPPATLLFPNVNGDGGAGILVGRLDVETSGAVHTTGCTVDSVAWVPLTASFSTT